LRKKLEQKQPILGITPRLLPTRAPEAPAPQGEKLGTKTDGKTG